MDLLQRRQPSESDPPGSAGVPPASLFLMEAAEHQRDFAGSHQVSGEPQRPSRRRSPAPLPVDPSGGDGRGCGRHCAGGTPALPGGLHPPVSLSPGGRAGYSCRNLSSCLSCASMCIHVQKNIDPLRRSRLIQVGGDGRGCARLGAGGTPALPGGGIGDVPCARSPEADPSVFRSIRVHSWPFVVRLYFLPPLSTFFRFK